MHKNMVGHIPHQRLRRIALLNSDTLQNCHPTLPKNIGQCMPTHGLCAMWKSYHANVHDTPTSTYKGLKKEFRSIMLSMRFGYSLKHQTLCEWQHKKYVLNWPISLNTWPINIDTNLSWWTTIASFWRWTFRMGMNKLADTNLPPGQAPRFPHNWLKYSILPNLPIMIAWIRSGRVHHIKCEESRPSVYFSNLRQLNLIVPLESMLNEGLGVQATRFSM